MLRLKRGERSLGRHELATYATTVIAALRETSPYPSLSADPPVVVIATPQTLDVGVRGDLAAEHPKLVERMAAELAAHHGITAVTWLGRDALEVHTAWEAEHLQLWLSAWLKLHLPFDR